MKCPPPMENEEQRLKALVEYGLGPDYPLPSLDPLVEVAARMFNMPVSAVNMIGDVNVFFAASIGIGEAVDMSRRISFCAHVITQSDVLVVADTTQDERFSDNPLVSVAPYIRFYAGAPICTPNGLPLGALCVIDLKPHHNFSEEDRRQLRELAAMATDRLELRRIEYAIDRFRPRLSYHALANNSANPFLRLDSDLTIAGWNSPAAKLFGYEIHDGPGMKFDYLIAEYERAKFRECIKKSAAAGYLDTSELSPELTGRSKDGSQFLFEYGLSSRTVGNQFHLSMALRDLRLVTIA